MTFDEICNYCKSIHIPDGFDIAIFGVKLHTGERFTVQGWPTAWAGKVKYIWHVGFAVITNSPMITRFDGEC